jgi:hypothetical protein
VVNLGVISIGLVEGNGPLLVGGKIIGDATTGRPGVNRRGRLNKGGRGKRKTVVPGAEKNAPPGAEKIAPPGATRPSFS